MVAEGDALVVLEAMKMEHTVVAPCDGQVWDTGRSHRPFSSSLYTVEADDIGPAADAVSCTAAETLGTH